MEGGTIHTPTAHEVETFSGTYVDTSNPSADSIVLEDIAHALSQTCRYGGHCQKFYSVAEHAVLVSRRLEALGHPAWVCLAGLHHDDAEAYLGDIPRPMKGLLGDAYTKLTEQMDEAIVAGDRFVASDGVPILAADFHLTEVKNADNWSLFVEARHLLPSKGLNWAGAFEAWDLASNVEDEARHNPSYWTGGVIPILAEGMFLSRHYELTFF